MIDLVDVSDKTQIPMPDILEDWAINYVFKVVGNDAKAQPYEGQLLETTLGKGARSYTIAPRSLSILDKLDNAEKIIQRQARSLWNFKGRKAMQRLYGGSRSLDNRDSIKESGVYDDWR
jgi:hypothetical protein